MTDNTPTTEDIRENWADLCDAGWLREHDAALIESLADDLACRDYLGLSPWGRRVAVDWLRKEARERREGVS